MKYRLAHLCFNSHKTEWDLPEQKIIQVLETNKYDDDYIITCIIEEESD